MARVSSTPPKLVLCVIDAMAPAMLERTVGQGAAPTLQELMQRGRYVPDCVAAFPSVTPVCAASIVTGVAQDRHGIPAMNWFHREEDRYVEYGSSFRAAQRFGIARQLTDTVYNMNRAHLSSDTPTVFETLDDADVRTAGTTYLMYRGRYRHEPQRDTALTRIASTLMRHPVMGPRELFYADIFASRRTGCRSGLGMPGVRDRHSGCVSGLHGRARSVRLPAALAPGQRLVLAQVRPRRAGSVDRAGRPPARPRLRGLGRDRRVPLRARGDRDGRPFPDADHAHDRAPGRAR